MGNFAWKRSSYDATSAGIPESRVEAKNELLDISSYEKKPRKRTTKFLLPTRAFEEDVELELSVEQFLDSVKIATSVHLVRKLEDKGWVGMADSRVPVRQENLLRSFDHALHDEL